MWVNKRVMPVGEQCLSEVRKKRFLYANELQYITHLVRVSKVYFLRRPRHLGKSLLLSTLEAYFRGFQVKYSFLSNLSPISFDMKRDSLFGTVVWDFQNVIQQIKAHGYATPYSAFHKKGLLIHASFDAEKRNSGAWKVQELASNQS